MLSLQTACDAPSATGHPVPPVTFLDRDLERYETVWAAGGSPNAVFALTPADLVRLTGAAFGDVAKSVRS